MINKELNAIIKSAEYLKNILEKPKLSDLIKEIERRKNELSEVQAEKLKEIIGSLNFMTDDQITILTFEEFWELYDKKVGSKSKLKRKWELISESDRAKIKDYIPLYIHSQPDKRYRKNPETFLNNKSWNDEIYGAKKITDKDLNSAIELGAILAGN